MSSSTEARRLTEAHRVAQAHLGEVTVGEIRSAWPTLDLSDLDGSFEAWLAEVAPVVGASRATSARLAGNYYMVLRSLEVPGGRPIVPSLAEVVSPEQLATSLRVTGPVAVKSAVGRGVLLDIAAPIADQGSANAGMRLALNGGRETLMETIKTDPAAQRWERVTSDNPCAFCEMLAGRGAVYKEDTVDFEAHDGCSCSAEPGF